MPGCDRALVTAALLAAAATAAAQSDVLYIRPGSGARAAGMANAFIGISDDGTAASWNPAGLAQLRKPELSVVGNTSLRSGRMTGFRSRDDAVRYSPIHSSFLDTFLDFASVAVPLSIGGKPVTLQASWRRLYALDYRQNVEMRREPLGLPAAVPARIHLNNDLVGSVNHFSLAGAVKVTPRLALGGSFNRWYGRWEEQLDVTEVPEGSPPLFRNLQQWNRIRGDNYSVGLLLTYPRWSVGLIHLDALRSDFDAESRIVTNAPTALRDQVAEGTLRFSGGLGIGAAWRPASTWTVAADLKWDDWTGATLEFTGQERISIFDGLPPERSATRDTLSMSAGAERLFHGDGFVVPLRFGAAVEPQGGRSPYTRDPVDWVMLAAGTGYNTNSLKFDAALQYRWANFRDGGHFDTSDQSPPDLPSAVGERNLREWRAKLSVILRVTDTQKLGDTLGKIFGAR